MDNRLSVFSDSRIIKSSQLIRDLLSEVDHKSDSRTMTPKYSTDSR